MNEKDIDTLLEEADDIVKWEPVGSGVVSRLAIALRQVIEELNDANEQLRHLAEQRDE